MTIFNVISMFGGLALFLYGMRLMGDGLKSGSTETLKKAMEKVTNNPVKGFLLGLIVTCVIQSSKATIVLTAGLVGAGIITLHQSMGIILGANVGTTMTGQIIRLLDVNASASSWLNFFKPDNLAPLAAIIGILLIMTFKFKGSDVLGDIAMGFGILFTGLLNMTGAVAPLAQSPIFSRFFPSFSKNPLLGFAVGGTVASLIQSSSATVGILQAFSTTGALTFSSVYAFIIGVNMCESVTTALVCSIGSKADAKRTGMIHVVYNFFSMILVIGGIVVMRYTGMLDSVWNSTINSGGIANLNTIIRLISAVLLLPFVNTFEKIAIKIIKDDRTEGRDIQEELSSLDEKLFSSPALALTGASNTVSKMAELAIYELTGAMNCINGFDTNLIEQVKERENRLDILADGVSSYLARLAQHTPDGRIYDRLSFHTRCVSELERIGDHAVNITETAEDLRKTNSVFSNAAVQELEIVHDAIKEITGYAHQVVINPDSRMAHCIEPLEEVIDDLVAVLRKKHIQRLHAGICSTYSGLNFLDILSNLERISDQCSNIGLYALSFKHQVDLMTNHNYIKYLHSGKDEFFNKVYDEKHKIYFDRIEKVKEI